MSIYIAEIGANPERILWHLLAKPKITLCGWDAPRSTRETNIRTDTIERNLCPACRMVQDASEDDKRQAREAAHAQRK